MSPSKRTQHNFRQLHLVVWDFHEMYLRFPSTSRELDEFRQARHADAPDLVDGWRWKLEYRVTQDYAELRSLGKDGLSDTSDDYVMRVFEDDLWSYTEVQVPKE